MSNPHQEQFFAAIGRVVVSWALLESPIDAMVHIIHQRVGGHEIETDAPWAIGRKLKFLKRCFRKIGRLSPQRDAAIDLFMEVKTASDFRHDIVHGAVGALPQDDTPIKFSVLTRGDLKPKVREIIASTPAILATSEHTIRLANRAATIAEWLLAEFVKGDRNDTGGKVAG